MLKKTLRLFRNNKGLFPALIRPSIKVEKKIYIVIRNDDLCAFSDATKEKKIFAVFEKHNIPQAIGVIPYAAEDFHNAYLNRYHLLEENGELVSCLREYQQKGLIEIVQHGFSHQTNICHPDKSNTPIGENFFARFQGQIPPYNSLNSEGYSELRSLSYEVQKSKILMGRKYLEKLLNTRIKTFIAPWNSLDTETLKALKENDFDNLLCSDGMLKADDLALIKLCQEDIFKLPFIVKEAAEENKPALIHMLYHSWMLTEEQIESLDKMLAELVKNKEIKFITPASFKRILPQMRRFFHLSNLAYILRKRIQPGKRQLPYYIFDNSYYKKDIYKSLAGILYLRKEKKKHE